MTTNEIPASKLELLKRLHALANDKAATEAEAATAMSKMQKLLLDYNLSIDDVSLTAEGHKSQVGEQSFSVWQYATALYGNRRIRANALQWMVDLAGHVAHYNMGSTLVVSTNRMIWFVGKPHNIEVMKEIWSYAVEQISALALEAYPTRGDRSIDGRLWMRNFCAGATMRIARRLRENWEAEQQASVQTKALIVVNDTAVSEYIEDKYGKSKGARHKGGRRSGGMREGYEAGARVNIGTRPAQVR